MRGATLSLGQTRCTSPKLSGLLRNPLLPQKQVLT